MAAESTVATILHRADGEDSFSAAELEWSSSPIRMTEPQPNRSIPAKLITICVGVLVVALHVSHIFLTSSSGSRNTPAATCIHQLGQIDVAANQFAADHHLPLGAPIHYPDDLMPYLKRNIEGEIPSCPSGGKYSINKVGEAPCCSLGTNLSGQPHVLSRVFLHYPP